MKRSTVILFRILVILYIIALAILCFGHFGNLPQIHNKILGLEQDKVFHFLMFLPFPLLSYFALGKSPSGPWKALGIVLLIFLAGCLIGIFILTCGYFPYAVSCWFGNVFDRNRWQGLNATAFLDRDFPEDASAIRWLNQEVEFQPLILEAYGDSYSGFCVVSAMTGLPTLEGWYVHEWLWRGDTDALNKRRADIDFIYTADDEDAVRALLYGYDISYIYVGSNERAAYPELNHRTLQNMGDIVFEDGDTYIVAVGHQ